MRAVRFDEYGPADRLRVVEAEIPEPGPGQVRVAVRAAGVNPVDWKLRSGDLPHFPVTPPHVPGIELAGVVDAVGRGADFTVGQEVFGWADTGAYAEYALASDLAAKPERLSWTDAAALTAAGETSLRVLRLLAVVPGETLLVHGAGGAVGGVVVQLALARGATVVGTAGERSRDRVRSLGAVPVRYGPGLTERVRAVAPQGIDAALDAAGHGALPALMELRGGADRVLTIADPAAFELGVAFSGEADRDPALLAELADLVLAGELRIAHAASFPLERAREAHELSETGHSGGKIVIEIR